jgi:hypothetical protein
VRACLLVRVHRAGRAEISVLDWMGGVALGIPSSTADGGEGEGLCVSGRRTMSPTS